MTKDNKDATEEMALKLGFESRDGKPTLCQETQGKWSAVSLVGNGCQARLTQGMLGLFLLATQVLIKQKGKTRCLGSRETITAIWVMD